MSILWFVFLAAALAIIQSWLFGAFAQKRMEYKRAFDRDHVHEGERVHLLETIKNGKLLPIPWVRIESRISNALQFKRSEEREINAEQYHKSVFFVGPFSKITRRHEITCLKRGVYPVGSLAVTTGDLFAMNVKSREYDINCQITVYPSLLPDSQIPEPATRWQGELVVRRFISPDPSLMNGIRDYRDGDPMRTVHWGATARMNSLIVKQFDATADPRALIILNVQTTEEQWGELMDYEQDEIERGIRLAATLAARALSSGVEAGFAANACYHGEKGEGKCIYVPCRSCAEQADAIFTAMARLQIFRELTFPQFLDDMSFLTGNDIIVLSCYISPAIEAAMNRLRGAGNTVSFVSIGKQ